MTALVLALLLLFGCAKPLPPDKTSYVGQWHGLGVDMLILADGSFAYKRIKAGASTSINAPIKEFDGDDFLVGIGPITTRFDVTTPPHQENGVWKMTVDGVELIRGDSPGSNESAPPDNDKPTTI
jgi:hypothetical protein